MDPFYNIAVKELEQSLTDMPIGHIKPWMLKTLYIYYEKIGTPHDKRIALLKEYTSPDQFQMEQM
jgi:hypothetical protein